MIIQLPKVYFLVTINLKPETMKKITSIISRWLVFIILASLLVLVSFFALNQVSTISNNPVEPVLKYECKVFLVTYVLDGDTIEIETGERVRYDGIDAPEKNTANGLLSLAMNEKLVKDKRIILEYIPDSYDIYGRRLAYIWADNKLVNEVLVEEGLAKVYYYQSGKRDKYRPRLENAQARAKEEHKGLWLDLWEKENL